MSDVKRPERRGQREGPDPTPTLREALRVPPELGLPSWATRLLPAAAPGGPTDGDRALSGVVFGVVDLETTGLDSAWSEILEIGLVVLRHGLKTRRFQTLVRPNGVIPPSITSLTGLRSGDVMGAPNERDALSELHAVLEEEGVEALVAHNARFDRSFLVAACERQTVAPPYGPFLCTVRLARRLVSAPRYRLDVLADELGLLPRTRHRALGDAELAADLFAEILRRAGSRGISTLESLQTLQSSRIPSKPKKRPSSVDAPDAIR
jgi:DNA polymerase-3 subunit epsilon